MRWVSQRLFRSLGGAPAVDLPAVRMALLIAGMGMCVSFAVAFTLPALARTDEPAHLAYVSALWDGELPTVDTPMRGDRYDELQAHLATVGRADEAHRDVWVANHPPLAYVVAAGPVQLAASAGVPLGASTAMRVVNVMAMALGVLATAAVADALSPGHRQRSLLAAAIVSLTPMVVIVGALGQTDGVSFALATALLARILRLIRWGVRPGEGLGDAALLTAAALTRAALLPLVVLGIGVWLVAAFRSPVGARRWAPVVALAPVLLSGWFYARNLHLYGDVTGAAHLQEKFGRTPNESTLRLLFDPHFWMGVWQEMWSSFEYARLGTGMTVIGSSRIDVGTGFVIGLGILLVLGLGAVRWRRPGRAPSTAADRVVGVVAIGWLAVCAVGMASFVSGGGTPHPRYLLPALSVIAWGLALGFGRALGARCWVIVPILLLINIALTSAADDTINYDAVPLALRQPFAARSMALMFLVAAVVALVSVMAGSHLRADRGRSVNGA